MTQRSLWVNVAVIILVFAVGLTLVSAQTGQVYAARVLHRGGSFPGWWHRGGWYGGGFAPAYPVYSCPPGYVYNPNIYNPNVYPPYCQPVTP